MLPLVEFKIDENLSILEAIKLINTEPSDLFNINEIAMNKVDYKNIHMLILITNFILAEN